MKCRAKHEYGLHKGSFPISRKRTPTVRVSARDGSGYTPGVRPRLPARVGQPSNEVEVLHHWRTIQVRCQRTTGPGRERWCQPVSRLCRCSRTRMSAHSAPTTPETGRRSKSGGRGRSPDLSGSTRSCGWWEPRMPWDGKPTDLPTLRQAPGVAPGSIYVAEDVEGEPRSWLPKLGQRVVLQTPHGESLELIARTTVQPRGNVEGGYLNEADSEKLGDRTQPTLRCYSGRDPLKQDLFGGWVVLLLPTVLRWPPRWWAASPSGTARHSRPPPRSPAKPRHGSPGRPNRPTDWTRLHLVAPCRQPRDVRRLRPRSPASPALLPNDPGGKTRLRARSSPAPSASSRQAP